MANETSLILVSVLALGAVGALVYVATRPPPAPPVPQSSGGKVEQVFAAITQGVHAFGI